MKYLGLIISVALLSSACGNDMSKSDARKALMAVSGSASAGTTGAQNEQSWAMTEEYSDSFEYSMTCYEGGNLHLVGSMEYNTATGGSFDFDATYNGCATYGVTVDGNLSIDGSFAAEYGSSTISMVGNLEFSGDVDGECDINITFTSTYSETGETSATYSGTICGYDAEDLT